jgi:hypothetical protein
MLGYNWLVSLVTWRKSSVVAGTDFTSGEARIQILGNYFTLGLVLPYDPLAAPDKIGKSVCVRSFF